MAAETRTAAAFSSYNMISGAIFLERLCLNHSKRCAKRKPTTNAKKDRFFNLEFDAKMIVMIAGPERNNNRKIITAERSSDKASLSLLGSLDSKLGERAPEISACERSNKPEIATRKPALQHERICIDMLLYGRYLNQIVRSKWYCAAYEWSLTCTLMPICLCICIASHILEKMEMM